jgi:hypothetical protein
MKPSIEELSDTPERDAYVEREGTWKEQAARLRDDGKPTLDPTRDEQAVERIGEQKMPVSSAPGGGFLGLSAKQGKEERIAEQGRTIERMVDTGIRSAEDYGLSDEVIDEVMQDKTQIEMQRRKEAADGRPTESIAGEDEGEKSYWKALKKKVGGLGEEYFRDQETPEATARVREQQYETLGAMYLDAVARENPDLADEADEIIDDVAGKYGISGETYHRTLATQLDNMFKDEQMTIDGVQRFKKELVADMPQAQWENNKLGYIGGKLIENSNSVAYMAAGMATRSPGVLVALMGTDIYNRTYTDARSNGRSQSEAFQDAVYSSAIEGATEGIPLARILKWAKVGNRSRAAKLLNGLGSEAIQEMTVEALQIGYDIGVVGEDITVGEAMVQLRDAGILGAVMGGGFSAPSVIAGDNQMTNLNSDIADAKKRVRALAMQAQNPNVKVDAKEINKARKDYAAAIKAKGDLILERKKAEAEKAKAKGEKKEAKRKAKLSPVEAKREAAQEAAEKADQALKGPATQEDIIMAEVLEKAGKAELEAEDADGVQRALDAGYLQITKAGTPVLLPAGQRRLEAVRAAETGVAEPMGDEVIEPVPYVSEQRRADQAAVDEEIGRLIRDEGPVIEPKPFTSYQRRKADLTSRVDSKVKDTKAREKIADAIIKADEIEQAYNERNQQEATEAANRRDQDYDKALQQQTDVDLEVANNLAILDEKSISGYVGTRIGDVLRNAMQVIEREEAKASKALKSQWANLSKQGTLFDVTGVLVKGTAAYANAVKVGALKITKHGLNYSAWTADMVGEFGESIKPVMARVFHEAKKRVQDVMKLSHEKFTKGERKGEMKFAPKQYAKPGQIRRLRKVLSDLAKEGEGGRMWYEKSGAEILKITGGDKKLARKLAGLLAIYSSGTAVSANTTNALKMWAQFYGAGKLVQPKSGTMAGRFSEQDRTAIEWLRSDVTDENFAESFGIKRFPFFLNIMRAIDPKNYELGQGVTVDLWMMRAFGFDQEAPTDAQSAFVATEIKALADAMGWEKQQAQAAVWVAIKARWEYIQKVAKQKAVDMGMAGLTPQKKGAPLFDVIGNTREEQIENEKAIIGVFRTEALKVTKAEVTKKLEESKADFADNLANHYATISWEAEPSTKLGSNLNALSLEDKIMLQTEIARLLTNPKTGREFLAEWLDLLGADQVIGPGAWDMNVGSTVQNSVIVPVMHKPGKVKAAQKEAAQAMDGYAAILGYLLQQDAVAWHKPFYSATLKDSNGVEIAVKGTLSHAKTQKFYDEIVELTGEPDFAPIILDGAVRVLNFTSMNNREFHSLIDEAATRAGINGAMEVFQSDGNLVFNDWTDNKKGQSYVEAISKNQNPKVQEAFERAKRKFGKGLAEIYAKYSSEKADARVRAVRLTPSTKLGRIPKGHLRFRHFGKQDVSTLDIEKVGTGIKGEERKRGSMKVISAYPNKGFKKEPGLGSNEYVIDVPKTKMYDVNADQLGLKLRAQEPSGSGKMVKGKFVSTGTRLDMNKLEQLIKDEGFLGYYTPRAEGNLKGQARFFHSLNVTDPGGPTIESTFSISDRPRVTVVENEFDEFEVREKDGEVYYTPDADDAIRTARSIHGQETTVVIVDPDGDVITTDVAKTKPARIKLGNADPSDQAAVSEFLDEWIELTSDNPISPDERVVGDYAAVTLRPQGGQIWLDSIRSFEKTRGNGSRALKMVLDLADQHGVVLRLTAKPFDTGGNELDFASLVQWYESNGFVSKDVTQDYEPSASMTRLPRNASVDTTFAAFKRPDIPTNQGFGVTVEAARSFIEKHFGKFYGLTNFQVVESVEELPDSLYGQIAYFGYHGRVRGVYHDDAVLGPTIYIVTNNQYITDRTSKDFGQPDLDGMIETILHETIGHFGMRALLGNDYNEVMDLIRRDFPREVAHYSKNMSKNPNGQRLAAEEFVAYTAEGLLTGRDLKKNQLNMIRRFIADLKVVLASMGIRKLNHTDIADLVMRSASFVNNNSQAKLVKRALMVERLREGQAALEKAAGVSTDYTPDKALSISDMKALPKGEMVFVENEEGGKQVFLDGKNIGYLLPTVSDEVLRSSPGIQSWSQAGSTTSPTKSTKIDAAFSIGMKQARKDDPALDRFMNKIGHSDASALTKLRDWWELRKRNLRREFEIQMLDQFAGIKHMERELGILGPESGYMSVRLTAGTDVIIHSAIENGVPIWHADGSVAMDENSLGLLEVLAPVAINPEMLKAFEAFIVARRARRLSKEGRERLFGREEIGAALQFIRKNKLHKLFNQTAKDLAAYKKRVLDFAQEAGLIDPVTRKVWEHHDHVPFYRVIADNHKSGPFAGSAVGKVGKVIHRLKGGTDPLQNPLESIVQNLSLLIEASVKNRASADVINNFMGTGVITKAPQAEMTSAIIPMKQVKEMLFENGVSLDAVGQELLEGIQKLTALQAPTAENIISVQENGTKQFYYVHDAGVMRGLDNVSPTQWISLMKILRFPKRLITRSITLMPDFILKNWFRDVFHTYMLHRHGTIIPVAHGLKGWAQSIAHDKTFNEIMSGGGMFDSGYVNASDPEKQNIAIRRGLLGKGRHNILDTPKKLKDFYMRIANGAENAHRVVVYQKTLKETGSRKQALFEARDLMDFSVRGANPIVRFLTETVPFWGARVQGISRTGKGFTESFALTLMRATPIVLASIAMYAYNADDERYNSLNPYEKRMYYHFYDVFEDGDHYRLPKPFEVGAIFSTIPEIFTEYMLSQEPDRGDQARVAIWWTVTEMLNLMPEVQAINPALELMMNENSFTEAPIISEWDKQMDPREQVGVRTDRTIRWLAENAPEGAPEWVRSPKQLEHLARGYLGSALDYTLAASGYLFNKQLNGEVDLPEMRWDETPFFKSFKREERGKYDVYIDSMYEVINEADKIHNSINKVKKQPRSAEREARVAELREKNAALLAARPRTKAAAKKVSAYNKQIRKAYADRKMNPAEKRAKVDALYEKRSKAAEKVYDYRPGGKLNKVDGKGEVKSHWEALKDLVDKPKAEQVDALISAQLPHTATLVNDIDISNEKLRSLV